MRAKGAGIRNVVVTLTGADGTTRSAVTGSFGYFRFDEVEVGATYVLSVHAKRFTFSQPTQVISVKDDMDGIIFTADQ